ncbi:helix loop helix DNA-binding domain protein [Ceratobasidium sp. AG-Ba]|nr:helix loop helix DNA-binding domain protein [Ceratobasidium sp. AG-Ba]
MSTADANSLSSQLFSPHWTTRHVERASSSLSPLSPCNLLSPLIAAPLHGPVGNRMEDCSKHPTCAPPGFIAANLSGRDTSPPHPAFTQDRPSTCIAGALAGVAFPNFTRTPTPPSLPTSTTPPPNSLNLHRMLHHSVFVHRRSRGLYHLNTSPAPPKPLDDLLSPPRNAVPAEDDDEWSLGSDARANRLSLCASDVRRRKIVESEQRRRNDLRGGFARLKDALPALHEKCSKMISLERG